MRPTAAILIIGNEILSGRTQDTNIQYLAKRLGELGIPVREARVIPDEVPVIAGVVRELAKTYTYVFTTGGIGATHDDKTAVSIAEAFGVGLHEHPEALAILQEYYGENLNAARRRMALMPVGALLLGNNPPAFQISNVFALAGIPSVMQGMFESLVERLEKGIPIQSVSIQCQLPENLVADDLARIQDQCPEVDIGSYPFVRTLPDTQGNAGQQEPFSPARYGATLVIRGTDSRLIDEARQEIVKMIRRLEGIMPSQK